MDKYLKEHGWKEEVKKDIRFGTVATRIYYTKGNIAITRLKVGSTDVWTIYDKWNKENHC